MSGPWAVARGVTKTYGRGRTLVRALTDVDLEIHPGQVTMIQGPSGSGKTTLLQVLGMLLRADRGELWIGGERMDDVPESRRPRQRRRHVAFIFQGFNLLESLTARDNVAVGARLRGHRVAGKDRAGVVNKCLDRVGLALRADHLPCQLSGGEKQRTSIARALACPGRLVLADEPTASLDTHAAGEVMEHLVGLAHLHGRAVVFVSHDLRLERYADTIVGLADGRITDIRDTSDRSMGRRQTNDPSAARATGPGDDAGGDAPAAAGASSSGSAPTLATQGRGSRTGNGSRLFAWLIVGALVTFAAVWAAVYRQGGWNDSAQHAAPVETGGSGAAGANANGPDAGRSEAEIPVVAAAVAVVEPITRVIAVGTERPGRIKAILKEAGEPVRAGEPIALLDDATAAATVAVRRADLRMAEANLADLRAWRRAEERARAKARMDRAQALLDRYRREHERIAALRAGGSAPQNELDDAVESLRVAESEFVDAQEAYRLAESGPTDEEVRIAEARIAQAQAALELAEAEWGLLTVRSPIEGHVVYRYREPGEIVDVDSELPIVSVGRLDQLRLRAEVDESDIQRVHVGQAVLATADALGDQALRGRVVHMEPIMGRKNIRTQRTNEMKDTKVREVLIDLAADHPPLPIDLQMTVRFLAADDTVTNPGP